MAIDTRIKEEIIATVILCIGIPLHFIILFCTNTIYWDRINICLLITLLITTTYIYGRTHETRYFIMAFLLSLAAITTLFNLFGWSA